MLREIPNVKQTQADKRRRWFNCDGMDLFVWEDANGAVSAFELCYGGGGTEHALRWRRAAGLSHHGIDSGESTPFEQRTPIAVANGNFDAVDVALRFEAVAAGIEPRLYRLVLSTLLLGRITS